MNPALTLRLAAATLALTSFAVSACSSSDTTAVATATPAGASVTEVEPAPLCSKAAPSADAASGEKVILSRGVGWSFDQLVPAGYDGGTPRPLVLALGDGGVTRSAARTAGKDAIVLTVDGPADGSGWKDSPAELRFVKDLLLRAETSLCFDRNAVYIVGTGGAQGVADRAVQDMPGSLRSM